MAADNYEWDLAVSFAGAQRSYVEEYVESCRSLGLRVFYDRDMTIAFWGRNFIFEFRKVYGGPSPRFVVPFISAEYLASPYPLDEFAAAVEQTFRRGETYILPVRVGEVGIPAELVNPAVGWIQADGHTPAELAALTAQRVGLGGAPTGAGAPPVGASSASEAPVAGPGTTLLREPRLAPASFDADAALVAILDEVGRRLEGAGPTLEKYAYRCEVDRSPRAVRVQVYDATASPVCGLGLRRDDSFGREQLALSFTWPRLQEHGMNGWVTAAWDPDGRHTVAAFTDFGAGSSDSRTLSSEQLFAVLWDKIVDFLERRTG